MKFSTDAIVTISTMVLLWCCSLSCVEGRIHQRGASEPETRAGRGRRRLDSKASGPKSPKATKAPKTSKVGGGKGKGECFPGDAKVEVYDDDNDKFVDTDMKDVKIGDQLKCVEESGALGKCEVFLHWHPSFLFPDTNEVYQEIKHSEGKIVISEDHMIYLAPTATSDGDTLPTLPPLTGENFVKADNVTVGDRILVVDDDDNLVARTVEKNKLISKDTFYAPIVKGGKFFVDNVLTSSFVVFDEGGGRLDAINGHDIDAINGHDTAHYTLNAYYEFIQNLISTEQLDISDTVGKTRDDEDYIAWEAINYGNVTLADSREFLGALWYAQYSMNHTLTSEEAIRFEQKVREVVAGGNPDFTVEDLVSIYYQAVAGQENIFINISP
jgi:hypothetical protein